MHRIVLIVLAALFHIALSGQSKFHRGYPVKGSSGNDPDTSVVNLAGIQMKDGSYLSLDGIRAVADTSYSYLVLTSLKPKGDVSTSKLVQMEGNTRILHGSVSLIQATNDSIYFTCTTTATTDNRLIGCLNKSLDLEWTRVLDNTFDDKGSHAANLLDEGKDSLLYQLTQADTGDSIQLYFNQLNGGGTLLNNQRLSYNRINGSALPFEANHFEVNNDTSYVWTGSVRRTAVARSAAITILSKNRTPVFSKFYLPTGFQQAEGLKVIKSGKGYIVAGRYGNTFPLNQSFIFQTDSIGKIVWSKVFDAALSTRNVIDGLMSDKAGNIIVSGKIKLRDTLEAPFMLSLKQDGSQQWLVLYDRAKAHFNTNGGLFETQDMGYGYYQTDVDDEMTGKLKMGLIKTDYQGVTSCELKDSTALLKNQVFTVDTMATVMKAQAVPFQKK
ncbi:MAG: hypothetical protein IPN29_17800 [Saprospiraceae bacterium]|nr:hypothetical protein [Saprospiraceae bacterium]